jgi:hypothetical protein
MKVFKEMKETYFIYFEKIKDIIMNQCIRLVEALVTFAKIRPIEEIKLASVGFISTLGNLRSVNKF